MCGEVHGPRGTRVHRPHTSPAARPSGAQLKVNMLLSRLPRLRDASVPPEDAFSGTFHVNESATQLAVAYASAQKGVVPELAPCEIGIRITSGPNAGDTRVSVGPDGMDYAPGEVGGTATVLEFDPGSFVLTAFGRSNSGTIRGDRAIADRYLNLFFRI